MRLLASAAAGTLAALLLSPMADAEPRSLRHVTYDYSVASYCGLLTPAVEAGFHHELESLTESLGLGPDEAKAERIAGFVAADEEWSNRGLGGFRAWCEDEGMTAAAHFLGIAQTLR
ncbi:MAG: hypothetical protein ACFCUQ_18670 [Kiloniellales bacterium]